jgi:hypothetical protein
LTKFNAKDNIPNFKQIPGDETGLNTNEIFFVRSWNGDDYRGIAVFRISRKNEILDPKNCCHS